MTVLRVRDDGDERAILAPGVGVFRPAVREGDLVGAGQSIGTLDVLGVLHRLVVPEGTSGRVARRFGERAARVAVQHGDPLVTLSTSTAFSETASATSDATTDAAALRFPAPMSGRFYSRPSPDEPAFVSVGDTVSGGQTIGLLEVMKTFNRLVYQGEGLPAQATVSRIVPADGDDVVRGDAILLLTSPEGE